MPELRKLALFLDGTWNTVNDNTNVWRLRSLFSVDTNQACYYSKGVGTTQGERVSGGAFGYGLDTEVIDAYEWLIEHYQPTDRIFIFGFSRGAFTARSLAGFISKCGLLKAGAPISLNQLYARYRKGSMAHTIRHLNALPAEQLSLEDRWLKKYSMPIPIYFQGVWDTVGALGVPFGSLAKVSRSEFAFLETDLRINYAFAYHALAIDEHRKTFAPTLWTKVTRKDTESYVSRPVSDVEQRWFVGAHADVGGGYENGLLAQIPLMWLKQKAEAHGLLFRDAVEIDGDEIHAPLHDSFAEMAGGLYRVLHLWQPFLRSVGASASEKDGETTTTINETIDASVFDRWRQNLGYRPANLAAWADVHRIDVGSLQHSVRADDPTVVVV